MRARKNGIIHLTWLMLISLLVSGCRSATVMGPFTLDQAIKAKLSLPLYQVDPTSIYGRYVQATYFQIDTEDEIMLEAYFADKTGDANQAFARMTTYTLLKAGPGDLAQQVSISWAQAGVGNVCRHPVTVDNRPPFKASTYTTCFYWMNNSKKQYILYSTWAEKDTLEFINAMKSS
jgi:hypothetical protein